MAPRSPAPERELAARGRDGKAVARLDALGPLARREGARRLRKTGIRGCGSRSRKDLVRRLRGAWGAIRRLAEARPPAKPTLRSPGGSGRALLSWHARPRIRTREIVPSPIELRSVCGRERKRRLPRVRLGAHRVHARGAARRAPAGWNLGGRRRAPLPRDEDRALAAAWRPPALRVSPSGLGASPHRARRSARCGRRSPRRTCRRAS
jgi:hypothetical protein